MNAKMLGLFSGFPERRFTDAIAQRLRKVLTVRERLVFISAWPSEYVRNDDDAAGMHGMFVSCNMAFQHFSVIDARTAPEAAKYLIRDADCIFLMGGHAVQQYQLICEKGIGDDIRSSNAVILGVSAGSMNMAYRALDIWESHMPYEGLGLIDITIKAHVTQADCELLHTLMQISVVHDRPICAMADESAIFVQNDAVTHIGQIQYICKGEICPFTPELLCR